LRSRQIYLSEYYSKRRERRKQARKESQTCDSMYGQKLKSIRFKREDVLSINAIRNEDREFKRSVTTSRLSASVLTISIILHVGALFVLAWVKLYSDENAAKAEIPVVFVQEQKTRVLRRSYDVRPVMSPEKSLQHRPAGQQVDTRLDYRMGVDFYVSDASEEAFSQVRSLDHGAVKELNAQRPSIDLRKNLTEPMEVKTSSPTTSLTRLGVSGGHELLADNSSALAEPKAPTVIDPSDVLKRFLNTIRRKIESQKRYPISARNAGVEGRSGVRITIMKNGKLEKVEIMDSSGHETLDNAALQSVRDAAPFPPIPEATKRERISMHIYLVFKIT
jgi:TonB family protein